MGKKLLFLDLDGTLLNDEKQITPGNREALLNALDREHRVVICTGRPLSSARIQNDRLGLTRDGCYIIAFNGGMVYDYAKQAPLFRQSIPTDTALQVIALCDKMGVHVQAYDDTDVLVEPHNDNATVDRYCAAALMDKRVVADFHKELDRPCKLLAIDFENRQKLEQAKEALNRQFAGRIEAAFSTNAYLEIVPAGLNKGTSVVRLCQELGIDISDSIAVGDAENDLSMITAAGVGVCMANGLDSVKAIADYITTRDNNHDGVAEVVEKFLP